MASKSGSFVLISRDNRQELRCTKEELAEELWKRLL
jgi:hypothetical protein